MRSKEKEGDKQTFFLGRYRVVDEIGVGGMASVHLARVDGPGGFQKWVAIKRIHPHLVEDDQFVDMFLDEARIAAGISHANVAQVFELGKDDNTYWIAMEYLHGEPLREVMRRAEEKRQRITPDIAARICADAAEGLHAAHELRGKNGQLLGLVHRDVTPHNLFVTYDGYTKVVDFGIAKVADRLASTRAGTLKGKLAYMSPEQVKGSEVDRTTDVFALGVVLWEVTTNQRLFRMDTDLDTLEKVQACVVPPPSTLVPGYPRELEAIVLKSLAKRKQDRFQTAREFSRALQLYLARSGQLVGPEEVAQFVRGLFVDRMQKREAHLAWAAEVTSTVNAEKLRAAAAARKAEEPSQVEESESRRGPAKQPPPAAFSTSSGARPIAPPAPQGVAAYGAPQAPPPPQDSGMASQSLMDDDEDVPTTVAMREQMEAAVRAGQRPPGPGGQPPPGFGNQGPGYPQQGHGQQPNPYASPQQQGQQYGGYAQPPQQQQQQPYNAAQAAYGAAYGGAAAQPQPQPGYGEHTTALPNLPAIPHQGPDDLGSTIALPIDAPIHDPIPKRPGPAGGGMPNMQLNSPGGMGHEPIGAATVALPAFPGLPEIGPPQQPPPPQQQYGQQHGALPPLPPQSQIETALSLPRPDPAALWAAQQERKKSERRNQGVMIAVIALTVLCVVGIAALVFVKIRAKNNEAAAAASAAASASAAKAQAAAASASAAAAASASAAAAASASAKAAKEQGFLTVICNPYCDDVLDGGKSLGASPIRNLPVAPGPHKLTLKKGAIKKVVNVTIVAGQETQQKVPMQ